MRRRELLATAAVAVPAVMTGCLGREAGPAPAVQDETVSLVATTSVYDTGLIGPIQDAFVGRFGTAVDVISRGTGAGIETARRGDCDAVMMHARSLEDAFLRSGHGINRRRVMSSPFLIVGPEHDPAEIDGKSDVVDAFRAIADTEATFVSRGDESGTHQREQAIWAETGLEPADGWYREAGAGMGKTLIQADELGAYTLAVRGTFLAMRPEVALGIRLGGSIDDVPALLANSYGIAAVNPARHGNVNYDLAMAFIGFITSPEGQAIIENYTVDGAQLFVPAALSAAPRFRQYVPEGWEPDE